MTLYEDREYLHRCPVMPFLSIAYSCDVLAHPPKELFSDATYNQVQDRPVLVEFRDETQCKPIFTAALDNTKGLSFQAMYYKFSRLAFRVGYECPVTSYAIRRAAVSILASKRKLIKYPCSYN